MAALVKFGSSRLHTTRLPHVLIEKRYSGLFPRFKSLRLNTGSQWTSVFMKFHIVLLTNKIRKIPYLADQWAFY